MSDEYVKDEYKEGQRDQIIKSMGESLTKLEIELRALQGSTEEESKKVRMALYMLYGAIAFLKLIPEFRGVLDAP